MSTMGRLLIGIGNSYRRDDGAGPAVMQRLQDGVRRIAILPGEGTELLDAWSGEAEVVVVDAMRSGQPLGTLTRFDATAAPLPAGSFACLSHRFGLAEAVEMGRILGRLPRHLTIWGIEAEDFSQGEGMSPAVAAAVERLAEMLVRSAA